MCARLAYAHGYVGWNKDACTYTCNYAACACVCDFLRNPFGLFSEQDFWERRRRHLLQFNIKVAGGTGGVPRPGATLVQAEPFLEILLQGAPKDLSVCPPGGFGSGQTLRRYETAFASSRCLGAATLACGRFRVFALLRRCDTLRRRGSSRLCDAATPLGCAPRVFATLRRCDMPPGGSSPLRVFASSRRCDAAVCELLASSRHQIWLRAVARSFAVARCCVDASDAATLQPWGGWWVGLHAVVTSMYWLKHA